MGTNRTDWRARLRIDDWAPLGEPVAVSRRYELFNDSVLLLILAIGGYVLSDAPERNQIALTAPLTFAGETTWGIALAWVAIVGIIASSPLSPDGALQFGERVVTIAAAFWGASFLIGLLFYDAEGRTFISAVIYFSIASHLRRTGDFTESALADWISDHRPRRLRGRS